MTAEDAEASADEAAPEAADEADEAFELRELVTEAAELLAPDAADDARLDAPEAADEAEAPAPPATPKRVVVPIAVVMVSPALFVPVERTVSVEMGEEEPPLPPVPAPTAEKMVDSPTAVVTVLPPVVMVEKVVSVETGV